LLAHWVAPLVRTEEGEQRFVMICRNAQNLALKNDWSGFGQRTSASGTTVLDNVTVSAEAVFNGPAGHFAMLGVAIFQILHAAVDAGIAQASIDDSVNCLRDLARPWAAAGIERASDDPLSLRSLGMLQAHAHAADALLERGAHSIDEAAIEPCERLSAEAAIAALEAKSFAAEIAVDAANMLFEFGGARSTLARFGYDRHWRNARTHSLHDPVRWRQYEIGNFLVNGEIPAAAYRSRPS
jgi:alkylation response protein AidB-like acyl-CoA dehydrogenase